jgi:hypothetical protein
MRLSKSLSLALALAAALGAARVDAASPPAKAAKPAAKKPAPELVREQRALDILRASSDKLAAAKSMAFTAVVTYEYPSQLGPAIAYTTTSEVLMQRPDRLRVITLGDGPASEFYYDGRQMMAYAPAENLVAVAAAPPSMDAMLKAAYDSAAIYFPFTDLIVADPYKAATEGLKLAFYIGQSKVVGGVVTDMIAYATDDVFVQAWIGAEDKLPRRVRAVYRNDPQRLRHQLDLANWQLDAAIPADAFASVKAAAAPKIAFASPQIPKPVGAQAPKAKPARATAPKPQ